MHIPIGPNCTEFISMDGDFSTAAHKAQPPDCASCVYFSRRNCGKDTQSSENYMFDQPLL